MLVAGDITQILHHAVDWYEPATLFRKSEGLAEVDSGDPPVTIEPDMKEVIGAIDEWLAVGKPPIALATVISTWGSSPRKVGAKMAFTPGGGAIAGSVSGGCVEGAVIEAGGEVLAGGRPQLLHFGVADETAWDVGLACGGSIDVFVQPLDLAIYETVKTLVATHQVGSVATIIRGPDESIGRQLVMARGMEIAGTLGDELDTMAVGLATKIHSSSRVPLPDGSELFVDVLRPSPTLIIVGGAHIAVALAQMAHLVGFRTVVIDPRRAFAAESRFPGVDRLIHAWPDKALADFPIAADTAVVTLSHDPKIDDPAQRAALDSDAFYIGALGSRKTHAQRRERLAAMGFSAGQMDRIHAPVGLDIGASTPEEIALAIMGQIVAAYRGMDNL